MGVQENASKAQRLVKPERKEATEGSIAEALLLPHLFSKTRRDPRSIMM
jgi:hypothetical protein